jgi:ribosome production factor 1
MKVKSARRSRGAKKNKAQSKVSKKEARAKAEAALKAAAIADPASFAVRLPTPSFNHIRNKERRADAMQAFRAERSKETRHRKKLASELVEEGVLEHREPATQESTAVPNVTALRDTHKARRRGLEGLQTSALAPSSAVPEHVHATDGEVAADMATDKLADALAVAEDGTSASPKIWVTTQKHAPGSLIEAVTKEIVPLFPCAKYVPRRGADVGAVCAEATALGYSDVLMVTSTNKHIDSLYLMHLPAGPSAFFNLTSLMPAVKIRGKGRVKRSIAPELILNNFSSRLGHSLGRMFAALWPRQPDYKSRRVITLHNQRDFIFFRQHRYVFDAVDEARLQEIGPRFTLKLRALQTGLWDSKNGQYEWRAKSDVVDASARTKWFN